MLNYQCFEKLAMSGNSANSEIVRDYFVKLREFLVEHQSIIYQSIENKTETLKKYSKFEAIYFFAVDEKKIIYLKLVELLILLIDCVIIMLDVLKKLI